MRKTIQLAAVAAFGLALAAPAMADDQAYARQTSDGAPAASAEAPADAPAQGGIMDKISAFFGGQPAEQAPADAAAEGAAPDAEAAAAAETAPSAGMETAPAPAAEAAPAAAEDAAARTSTNAGNE